MSNTGLGPRPTDSLSPSRAGDFMTCPQLYKFRSIDRIPEPPGVEATRGTLVHSVLDRIFDLPTGNRGEEAARALIRPTWDRIAEARPELNGLLFGPPDAWQLWSEHSRLSEPDGERVSAFLDDAAGIVVRYFRMEDPNRLEPAERELSVSTTLDSGLVLRGIVDRLDRASSGALRIVDYKSGRAPGPGWESKALFQLRFYGLIVWREYGQVPARLQLMYLSSEESISVEPGAGDLLATQRKLEALWQAVSNATRTDEWRASPSRLCDWCHHRALCPAWSDPGVAKQPGSPVSVRT